MSNAVMNLVLQRYPRGGSNLLCMIILANWCDDEGRRLFPSITGLAKHMRLSKSQARRILHDLFPPAAEGDDGNDAIQKGEWWVRPISGAMGGAKSPNYEINVARLQSSPMVVPERTYRLRKGTTGSADARGGTDARGGGITSPGVSSMEGDPLHRCDPNPYGNHIESPMGRKRMKIYAGTIGYERWWTHYELLGNQKKLKEAAKDGFFAEYSSWPDISRKTG